ncbi:MAG: CDP-alcohol phosphatidyltransferase family protein [Pseudomonadota bacterium]
MEHDIDNRRPIQARSSGWAQRAARALAGAGVSANAISVASVVFAFAGAAALLAAPIAGPALYVAAALLCPLRLLANLFDGMVAVEHDKATPTGPLYNEIPDRLSDVAVLAAAGTAAAWSAAPGLIADWGTAVGWLAAAGALMTAYVRELGRALGAPADFGGPLAKQQRMWVVTVAALTAAFVPEHADILLFVAVTVVALGAALTAALRTRRLAAHLRRAADGGGDG